MRPVSAIVATIDRAMPYRGRCGICGGPDARHREWDAWRGMFRRAYRSSPPAVRTIARWHDRPVALVRAVVTMSPQRYGAMLRRAQ